MRDVRAESVVPVVEVKSSKRARGARSGRDEHPARGAIVGIFPELMAVGGVQRISLHTAAALTALARQRGSRVRLFSLNDAWGRHELGACGERFTVFGFGRSKARLAGAVLAAAPRMDFAYVGHPNLGFLGVLAKVLRPWARYCVATYGIEVWKPLPVLRRLGLRWACAATSLSEFTARKLVTAQSLAAERVVVIPPAIDPDLSGGRSAGSPPAVPPGKILLTVARLSASERYKGVDHVIQALPGVLQAAPGAYYVVVGDGDDRRRLEALAAEAGVRDRVLFVGTKVGNDLASYYAACDVFVMPSWGEGFGVVFLEAMSHGKPVVAANHGGASEVVVEGSTGFLVEYGDLTALTGRLVGLLDDEGLRRRLGDAGRRRVDEHYTFERFRRRLENLLALSERGAP